MVLIVILATAVVAIALGLLFYIGGKKRRVTITELHKSPDTTQPDGRAAGIN
jgi:hypothetical protein